MAAEKITLYDRETELLLEVTVSSEDAERARADRSFAEELLKVALIGIDKEKRVAGLTARTEVSESHQSEGPDVAVELSNKEQTATAATSGSHESEEPKKSIMTSLLEKRLKQKEIQEHNKNKRHMERLEMDKKKLTALEKLIEK